MSKRKEYFILEPAKFRLDGGAMYGIIPKPLWERKSPPDEQNRIELALRLVLIKSEKSNIIIDTGIGDYHDERFETMFDIRSTKSPLKKALIDCGITPLDVTDVILSHLHFDHVGGLSEKDKDDLLSPVFKNATLHLHRKHYQYAINPTKRDAGSFQVNHFQPAIDYYEQQNKINWLEDDSGDILPEENIKFKCSNGHTPHLLHPYDESFFYLTDLIPTSNHVKIPWVMGYDIEPGVTTVYKEKITDFIIKENLFVIYEHDEKFWGSRLSKDEKGNAIPTDCQETQNVLSYKVTFN